MARAARPLADGSSWEDADYLNDLLDAVESNPKAVEARYLLAERYLALGWTEAAVHVAKDILKLIPNDEKASAILISYGPVEVVPSESAVIPPPSLFRPAKSTPNSFEAKAEKQETGSVSVSVEVKELHDGYQSLQAKAAELLEEMVVFEEFAPGYDCKRILSSLEGILHGQIFSVSRGRVSSTVASGNAPVPAKPPANGPKTAKELAHAMKGDPSKALEIAIQEFKDYPQSKGTARAGKPADEVLRDAVRKRAEEVASLLPESLSHYASDAFMHIEHEFMGRKYVNDETIVMGDSISEIPRNLFFVSEDGYAWDMSELVQAIKTNSGVMRNPLSKDSFTITDVEAILRHPLGKELAALQVEQSKLFQGVRPQTVSKLESIAKVLLGDDAEDSRISRDAVDDFFNYVATLPQSEKKAIDKLKVPARDAHTGRMYDATIGDALRDAKANKLCFHKAGDLCQQAGIYLKNEGGSSARRSY